MNPIHLFAAILTVALWGFNFVVIKWGLRDLPPLLFTCLRFIVATFPIILFVPRPALSWRLLTAYGMSAFVLQFAFLFAGMKLGMSAGLSSLMMQLQTFFTIGLAGMILNERTQRHQLTGAVIGLAGMLVVGWHIEAKSSLQGFLLVILAALSLAASNTLVKAMPKVAPLSLVVWGSALAILPLFVLSLLIEGPATIVSALSRLSIAAAGAIAYVAYIATLLCFALWSWLLSHHSTATVTPFGLLVPIFGIASAIAFLHEPFYAWELTAAALVFGGLLLNVFGGKMVPKRQQGNGDASDIKKPLSK